MLHEKLKAACGPCDWTTDYMDEKDGRAAAHEHDEQVHDGHHTAVCISESGDVHG